VDDADVVVTDGYSFLVAYAFTDSEGFLMRLQGFGIPPLGSVDDADVVLAGGYSLLVTYTFTDGEGFLEGF
jgi:hypothetical protein